MYEIKTNRLKLLTVTVTFIVIQLLLCTEAFAKPMMIDLGTLGGHNSFVVAINAKGQVIGNSDIAGDTASHGFIWENGKMTDLGTLGGSSSDVRAINEKGQVIGKSTIAGDANEHGFIWENGKMTDLGTLGGSSSSAGAINEKGQVVGASYMADGSCHGFIWENGKMTDLGTLGGSRSGVSAINEKGQVIGRSCIAGDANEHGFIWENGKMTDLGALGGDNSYPRAINEKGQVIGIYTKGVDNGEYGFIWENGKMTDLGTLGGNSWEVTAINEKGQVIGYSTPADGLLRGFIWENGKMTDLGTLGGNVSFPTAINEKGQVIGYSYLAHGSYHGFLWESGKMIDLGALSGNSSFASAISENGLVVGESPIAYGPDHLFIWENGKMTDLGSVVGNTDVIAMNEKEQIIGSSTPRSSSSHAFIWEDPAAPVISISPYDTNLTNKDITVTATTDGGTLNQTSYTFTQNGSFTFTATDEEGNTSRQTVTITNIDKTLPVITLKCNPVEYVTYGEIYVDAGAEAIDDRDGDISSLISVSGSVYTDIPATYTLTYSVCDKAGNAAIPVTRTVIVSHLFNTVTPSDATYDVKKLPTFTAALSALNKLTDIKNGSASLIAGKDYTVSGSTLSIAPGYLNYYFNNFPNQDLKLVLCFSAGSNAVLTVHPYWGEQVHVITPEAVKIDKTKITDVQVTITPYDNKLTSINNGTSALRYFYDYSISGNTVTIEKSFITYYYNKFPNQNLNITFKFTSGCDQMLSLYTSDSPNTEITPAAVTYNVGSKTDVTVTANMNGNFFSSINNGTSALVPRVDYTYATDTNTLYIRSSYIAYYFNKFDQDLMLTINFTGGKPVTLTIKPVR